jgi:hypothetical protein
VLNFALLEGKLILEKIGFQIELVLYENLSSSKRFSSKIEINSIKDRRNLQVDKPYSLQKLILNFLTKSKQLVTKSYLSTFDNCGF